MIIITITIEDQFGRLVVDTQGRSRNATDSEIEVQVAFRDFITQELRRLQEKENLKGNETNLSIVERDKPSL